MASAGERKEGDEWTMVDRVSELMENGGMSDISLPPLPALEGASEAGSQDACSENNEAPAHDSAWSSDSDSSDSSDSGDSGGRSSSTRGDHEGQRPPNGRAKHSASTATASAAPRRRTSARARGGVRTAASLARASSQSVSPARPRRRAGRTERNGRRMDEGPPPLQTSSEASDASSSGFSSSSMPTPSLAMHGTGFKPSAALATFRSSGSSRGGFAGSGGRGTGGGVGGGGSGTLVPFSLEDITCVASETVSASSSPFRAPLDLQRQSQSPSSFQAARRAAAAAAAQPVNDPSMSRPSPEFIQNLLLARRMSDAAAGAPTGATITTTTATQRGQPTAESSGSARSERSSPAGGRLPTFVGGGVGPHSPAAGASSASSAVAAAAAAAAVSAGITAGGVSSAGSSVRPRQDQDDEEYYGSTTSQLSYTNFSSAAASSAPSPALPPSPAPPTAASLLGVGSRMIGGSSSSSNGGSGGSGDGSAELNPVAPPDADTEAGAARTSLLPPGAQPRTPASGGSERPESDLSGSGAWSLAARGMTPLGKFFSAGGGEWGAGSGIGGIGGGGGGRATGSLMGLSGQMAAVLEARAEAAEEQGDFWQRRACAAEEENRRLQKVVADQDEKIAEVLQRCELLPAPTPPPPPPPAVSTQTAGVEEHKEASPSSHFGELEDVIGASAFEEKDNQEGGGEGGALEAIGDIAFTRFSVGQVAMFFPTPEGNFLAFNVGCPGHFLSKESQEVVGRDEHFRSYYVLGRIIEIQEMTCEEGNDYGLPCGQDIKVVAVEAITPDLEAAGLQ